MIYLISHLVMHFSMHFSIHSVGTGLPKKGFHCTEGETLPNLGKCHVIYKTKKKLKFKQITTGTN